MVNKEEEIAEQTQEGKILSRVILEVAGKPKEHVEKTLKDLVESARESNSFGVISYNIFEAKESDGIWSSFAELELLSRMDELVGFCYDFMPSSIEIIEPEELKIRSQRLTHTFNDLLGKLHIIHAQSKKLELQNLNLGKNMTNLVKNSILLILSGRELTKQKLSKFMGINKTEISRFLDALLKEDKIKKTKNTYTLK